KTTLVREGRSPREQAIGSLSRSGRPPLQLEITLLPLRSGGAQEIQGLVYVAQDVSTMYEMESELRRVNAERQSAYEELQSINEELQSTNEELETTNEELQSTNAELDATNRELATRTDEINQLAFLQRTIIRSLTSAVIVVDPKGRITLWNLAAERL